MKKLLLIDGNSIMNRAFYGVPLLSDEKGRYTNAVFGFLNILFKTIDDEQPTHVLVAFDTHAPTFRHKEYSEYKGNRKGMPDELRSQMPCIRQVLEAMNIALYEEEGIEADDILGSLSNHYENTGSVTILSGDRDMLQLASHQTKISIPRTKGGTTTTEHYNYNDFVEAYGFTPQQFIDVKGMMGDSSDNIPGIPGVGEKTAYKYIRTYETLEGLYEHIDDLKGKIKEKVVDNKDLAFLSRSLATIKRDCVIPISWDNMKLENYLNETVLNMFKDLNFTRLLTRFNPSTLEESHANIQIEHTVLDSYELFVTQLKEKTEQGTVAFHYLYEDTFLSLTYVYEDKEQLGCSIYEQVITEEEFNHISQEIGHVLSQGKQVVFYDVKQWLHTFNQDHEQKKAPFEDVHLMYYLLKPNKGNYPLEDLGLRYADTALLSLDDLTGKGKKKITLSSTDPSKRHNYLAGATTILLKSFPKLVTALTQENMLGLYNTLEKPLLYVLYQMEKIGIKVDTQVLIEISQRLDREIIEIQNHIYTLAGYEFNVNSPKQLGVFLFEDLRLPVIKKTKTGYSTNVDVLEKLVGKHPVITEILRYRQLTKLKSTYADGLMDCISLDGNIHTTFNQTIASTGRLSSTDPNLQNIPIRLEEGRMIRKAFIPREGHIFVSADYSQIELRVMAHLSQDPLLLEAYHTNKDIHQLTASQVFHVPFDEVTPTMRRNAKAVNFGIVYGISDYGLSRDLDIPISESKSYIEAYFSRYTNVKTFLDTTVEKAHEDGYVTTMYNRKREIPDLSSSNYIRRSAGERIAMNTPIQGAAADIIKLAMLRVYRRLQKEELQSKLVLQIHDELMLEVPVEEKNTVEILLIDEMEHAVRLSVPMMVNASSGKNWYETK